jgi:hypothetical protein
LAWSNLVNTEGAALQSIAMGGARKVGVGDRTASEYLAPHSGVSSRQCQGEIRRPHHLPGRREIGRR